MRRLRGHLPACNAQPGRRPLLGQHRALCVPMEHILRTLHHQCATAAPRAGMLQGQATLPASYVHAGTTRAALVPARASRVLRARLLRRRRLPCAVRAVRGRTPQLMLPCSAQHVRPARGKTPMAVQRARTAPQERTIHQQALLLLRALRVRLATFQAREQRLALPAPWEPTPQTMAPWTSAFFVRLETTLTSPQLQSARRALQARLVLPWTSPGALPVPLDSTRQAQAVPSAAHVGTAPTSRT